MRLKSALAAAALSVTAALGLAVPAQAAPVASAYNYTVQEYVTFVVTDVDQQFSGWYARNGIAEPNFLYKIVMPGEVYEACGLQVRHDTPNAYYCPTDLVENGVAYEGVIILPATTMQRMWSGDVAGTQASVPGDFIAAIVVAHEYAHGVMDSLEPYGIVPTGKNDELIADCLAGAWMATAQQRGMLTDTDVEEAVAALEAVGDKSPSGGHGTSRERVAALALGYQGDATNPAGSVSTCLAAYGS